MSNNIVATPPPRSRAASWFIVVPPSREIGPPTSRDTPAIVTICFRRACDVRPRIRTRIHTRTRTSLSLQSAANSSRPRSCSKRTRLKSFEIVWSRLKTFEDVWRRLNERFSISLKRYMIFFFLKTLRWERFVASSWEEGRYGCKRKWCEYQIRLGGEKSVLFIFLGKKVEIIDCFVLIRGEYASLSQL